MIEVISVRSDVLLCQGEYAGQLACGDLHDIQQIFGSAQNIAFLYRRGYSESSCIHNAVSFGSINGQYRIQLR